MGAAVGREVNGVRGDGEGGAVGFAGTTLGRFWVRQPQLFRIMRQF